jgi:hypothetical protein
MIPLTKPLPKHLLIFVVSEHLKKSDAKINRSLLSQWIITAHLLKIQLSQSITKAI